MCCPLSPVGTRPHRQALLWRVTRPGLQIPGLATAFCSSCRAAAADPASPATCAPGHRRPPETDGSPPRWSGGDSSCVSVEPGGRSGAPLRKRFLTCAIGTPRRRVNDRFPPAGSRDRRRRDLRRLPIPGRPAWRFTARREAAWPTTESPLVPAGRTRRCRTAGRLTSMRPVTIEGHTATCPRAGCRGGRGRLSRPSASPATVARRERRVPGGCSRVLGCLRWAHCPRALPGATGQRAGCHRGCPRPCQPLLRGCRPSGRLRGRGRGCPLPGPSPSRRLLPSCCHRRAAWLDVSACRCPLGGRRRGRRWCARGAAPTHGRVIIWHRSVGGYHLRVQRVRWASQRPSLVERRTRPPASAVRCARPLDYVLAGEARGCRQRVAQRRS